MTLYSTAKAKARPPAEEGDYVHDGASVSPRVGRQSAKGTSFVIAFIARVQGGVPLSSLWGSNRSFTVTFFF